MTSFLPRFTRFFTQSTRMSIAPESGASVSDNTQTCYLAAGCFWGVEHLYRKRFEGKGLKAIQVGYMGGDVQDPSYEAVCTGETGHAEAVEIKFYPAQLSYRTLLEFFYRIHDPETLNRQGPDRGTQYRSAIFYKGKEQEKIAREVTAQANAQWHNGKIVTEITAVGTWFSADGYHQKYLHKNPEGYECPSHFVRNFPELKSE